jgi:hypothetical protein
MVYQISTTDGISIIIKIERILDTKIPVLENELESDFPDSLPSISLPSVVPDTKI